MKPNLPASYLFWGFFFLFFYTACITDKNTRLRHLIKIEEAIQVMENTTNWRLFEVSKPNNYKKGHIKGAFNIWRPDYSNNEHPNFTGMRAGKIQLEELLSKYGVDNETTLLLYDEKGNCDAARFAWQLELWGFKKFHLINGGKKSYQLQGFKLNKTTPALPSFTNFKFKRNIETDALLATYKDVYNALKDHNSIVVDTLELYEFTGTPFKKKGEQLLYKKGAFTNGAIPTAKHYNWSNAVDLSGNHQLKSIKDLEYDLEAAGVQSDKSIILYCQSGTRSAHTSFVLRHILKYRNVKNYDGSWIEWSYLNVNNIKNAPVEVRYDK